MAKYRLEVWTGLNTGKCHHGQITYLPAHQVATQTQKLRYWGIVYLAQSNCAGYHNLTFLFDWLHERRHISKNSQFQLIVEFYVPH